MNKRVAGWFGVAVTLAYVAALGLTRDYVLSAQIVGYIGGFCGAVGAVGAAVNAWDTDGRR